MIRKPILIILISFYSLSAYTQPLIQKRLDSVVQLAHAHGILNGNVLIAKKGSIIYETSLGYADGSKLKTLSPSYKFDIGSVSKEFNGAAILLLKQRGLLSLDDPISKFLPQLPLWANKVKVRHLLNYTSGIPVFEPLSSEGDSLIWANLQKLKTLQFEPGSAYIYNHYNVFLQMRIVEKVSRQAYAKFIRQNIFLPLKMKGAVVDMSTTDATMAKAFDQNFKNTPYQQGMTGWVRLTARDLYLWCEALHQYKIVDKTSFKELSVNFPGGESSIGSTGFNGDTLNWHRHQGSNSNYEALLYYTSKQNVTVVIMTNHQQMKVDGIKNALLAVLFNDTITVPKKSVYLEIREKALTNVDDGLNYYRKLKNESQDNYDFSFEIGDLISTGKYLLRRNKFDDAIKVFQIAVSLQAKPADVSYGYELIGEAYLKKPDKPNAQLNYKQALNIDPANKNAAGMLQEMSKSAD